VDVTCGANSGDLLRDRVNLLADEEHFDVPQNLSRANLAVRQ